MNCAEWRRNLDAYVDGELRPQETAAMEEHLRTCRECAAEALARMQMKRATRAAASMRFTPPAELRQRIQKSIAPKRARMAFWLSPAFAVAVALVLVVAVSALVLARRGAREQAVAALVDLHVAALASPNPVDVVSTDRHTVKPWFQGKLPFTFNLPELDGSQYKLVGGKLVYFGHRPGAQLIYELRKHELSVFIVQEGSRMPQGGVSAEAENGFSVEAWGAGGLHYVIVSDANAGDVHALGELVRGAQKP
jgi:anti-sigma factor RsiW